MKPENERVLVVAGVVLAVFCHLPADTILWLNRGCRSDGCFWLAIPEIFSCFSLCINATLVILFFGFGLFVVLKGGLRRALPIALGLVPIAGALLAQMKFVRII
jgi:hypothetical protein